MRYLLIACYAIILITTTSFLANKAKEQIMQYQIRIHDQIECTTDADCYEKHGHEMLKTPSQEEIELPPVINK
ncbi:MAG: hypothetical protein AB2L11_09410 [Syntrophobacteraceae bacterium]